MQLAGLTPDQLTDTHQPCPLCGGEDRYRFDDLNGTGSWYCNQCGGKDQPAAAVMAWICLCVALVLLILKPANALSSI
jgi:phage/plasmid primase-like uncharacterized protein